MPEVSQSKHRVWFRLAPALEREALFDRVAGLLLGAIPEDAAIKSLFIYPRGEGASQDPRIVTVSWRLMYVVDQVDGRGPD